MFKMKSDLMVNPEQQTLADWSGNNGGGAATLHEEYIDGLEEQFATPDTHTDLDEFEITNIQATSSIGVDVDIALLTEDHPEAASPNNNSCNEAGFCILHPPSVTGDKVKLYETGTVCIQGGITTLDRLVEIIEEVHQTLRDLGIDTEWSEVRVTNMVIQFDPPDEIESTPVGEEMVDVSTRVNLNECKTQITGLEYHAESFAGAIYRTEDDNMTCMLFNNGKTVVQGTESVDDAVRRREELISLLNDNDIIGTDSA